MKLFALINVFTLAFFLTSARAQSGPDDQYIQIYALIQQAESLAVAGQPQQALASYVQARTELDTFSKVYPDWSPSLVTYRLSYLANKIAATTASLPPDTSGNPPAVTMPAAPAGAGSDSELVNLRTQVQNLQADNATLAAKLKEALSTQPSAADPRDLAAAQETLRSLVKENALLQVSLDQQKAAAPVRGTAAEARALAKAQSALADLKQERDDLRTQLNAALKALSAKQSRSEVKAQIAQLSQQNAALQARLAVDEAKPAPYSAEELALFRSSAAPAPTPAPVVAASVSAKELTPAEQAVLREATAAMAARPPVVAAAPAAAAEPTVTAGDLLASAQTAFAAGKYDQALDWLGRAASLDPQNAQVQNLLGVTLGHKGLRSQAEAAFRQALLLNPNYGEANNNLAVVYADEQPPQPELARWHYLKALAAGQPHNPDLEKILADSGAPIPAQ
jgi:tetratricopeptide (TPR) repeat protein